MKQYYKKLKKHYTKFLNDTHKTANKIMGNCASRADYFITSLYYLRDYYVLKNAENNTEPSHELAAIAAALNEYALFIECSQKYKLFKSSTKLFDGDAKEYEKKLTEESVTHWATFWKMIAENLQDWSVTD